jgi:hypothetical protein
MAIQAFMRQMVKRVDNAHVGGYKGGHGSVPSASTQLDWYLDRSVPQYPPDARIVVDPFKERSSTSAVDQQAPQTK